MDKKVGVIMPLYKQESTELLQAIMSLGLQIYDNWKLVIVLDGSDFKTKERLRESLNMFGGMFLPDVKIIDREENKGIAFTLNEGHEFVRDCDYVTWVSSDNIYYPQFLYVLVKAMDAHPECSLIYSNFDGFIDREFVYENPEWKNKFPTWDETRGSRSTYEGSPIADFGETSFIGQCFMYRVADLGRVKYNPEYERAEDYEFFANLLRFGNLGFVKEFLGAYRYESVHSYTTQSRERCKEQILRVRDKVREEMSKGVYQGRRTVLAGGIGIE